MIISYDKYDIYMIYQPFEQVESLYLESKLITSKNFIGTYFGHMVTISDLEAAPKAGPCHLFFFNLLHYYYPIFKKYTDIYSLEVRGQGRH